MIYYSTGKSSYLKKVGVAVEETNLATAKILIKKGYIVESLEQLKKAEPKETVYTDLSGKVYTEQEVLSMDSRTRLYKEIMRK